MGVQGHTPRPQRRVITLSKILLAVITLTFILVTTAFGLYFWTLVTPLGVFLISRSILQIIFAQVNNRRMVYKLGCTIADGLYDAFPDLEDDQIRQLEKSVAKRHRDIDKFLAEIQQLPIFQVQTVVTAEEAKNITPEQIELLHEAKVSSFWSQVTDNAVIGLGNQGIPINRPIDANVPIYGVDMPEVMQTIESLQIQIYRFRRVWLVLNDPHNEVVRAGLKKWISEQRQAAADAYARGEISAEERRYRQQLWQLVDLTVADKRTAMAAAWLSSMGVDASQLEVVIEEMFSNPEHQLQLRVANEDISLNVDSDTIAHPWASYITYLCFMLFNLSGLTSNVRIKNMVQFNNPWEWIKALFSGQLNFWSWLLAILTYFRYDFANNVERASESLFRNVVCMSGPWMGVVTHTIPQFLGRFVNYTFQGVRIKPGDDRKVTYELNRMRLPVGYCPWVVTYTDAPTDWARWKKQQDRWTMSMYANFFTSVKEGQLFRLHPWSMFDQLYAAGFSFLIIGVIVRLIYHCVLVGQQYGLAAVWFVLMPYVVIFTVINLFRGVYAAWDNQDLNGLVVSLYVFVVAFMLIPIKFMRLFVKGIAEKGYVWGGRAQTKAA